MMVLWALVIVVVCCGAGNALEQGEIESSFKEFMVTYNKNYADDEILGRFEIFKANLEYIEQFNKENTFTLGINKFSDLSIEEYRERLGPSRFYGEYTSTKQNQRRGSITLPNSVDWRNQSVVGPVLEATICEGAYASVGSVQSFCAIAAGKFQFYDPTQVASCINKNYCNYTDYGAWNYIQQNGLQAQWTNTCHSSSGAGCCMNSFSCFRGSENTLQTTVGYMGPITVSIDASHPSFQSYSSGIYYEPKCSSSNLTLNLLVVGYGGTGSQEYWIAQNFWGTSWGLSGYILMARNQNNNCGIASNQCHPSQVHQCK